MLCKMLMCVYYNFFFVTNERTIHMEFFIDYSEQGTKNVIIHPKLTKNTESS